MLGRNLRGDMMARDYDRFVCTGDIDPSIRKTIGKLYNAGLRPRSSCSGLKCDHIGRTSGLQPYITFESEDAAKMNALAEKVRRIGWTVEKPTVLVRCQLPLSWSDREKISSWKWLEEVLCREDW